MPSKALKTWQTAGLRALDVMEAAHTSMSGRGVRRAFARQQITHAYAVLLSSQFQRFCRDLHTEAVEVVIGHLGSPHLSSMIRSRFTQGRKLETGNPNPGNLGADFWRIGLDLWAEAALRDSRTAIRHARLDEMNRWRNAIAHHDFTSPHLGGRMQVRLADVKQWRTTCEALAVVFDRVVGYHLKSLLGTAPW